MNPPVRALFIEDDEDDALLVERILRESGLTLLVERVDAELTLRRALRASPWDLVLCDFHMPGFTGLRALNIVRENDADVPFIFVSGTIGEDVAVSAMRAGAQDYVLKNHLQRLAPAVERELREAQDRRERRLAQAALQRSEMRLLRVFESNVVGIAFWNEQGRVVDANDAFLRMVGSTHGDLEAGSVDWQRVTSPACAEADAIAADHITATGSCLPYKKEFVHATGEHVPVVVSASRLDDAEYAGVAVLVDISAERRAERERTEAHSLMAAMVESTPLPMILLDRVDRVSLWNPAATALFGWTAEEVVGQRLPWSATTSEGVPVSMFATRAPDAAANVQEVVTQNRSGEPLTVELRHSPIRDADGRINGTALIARDLTEGRRLEAKLRQAQKMEIVGNLASGIAHDFNNLLSVIAMSIDLALDESADRAHVATDLQTARDAAYRGAGLTRQLLNFSKPGSTIRMQVDLAAVVQDIGRMLDRLMVNSNVRMVVADPPADLWIDADRGQLEQIVLNLAINARDAMPNGGTLSISLERTGVLGHEMAELAVRDTGVGIPQGLRDKVFEPFFTTKEPGHGTGLGLSTVRELTEKNDGTVTVDSTLGEGTVFLLRFPLVGSAPTQAGAEPATPEHAAATVLLVDDEPLIRRIAERLIARLGYVVLTAGSGQEAVTAFECASPRPQLLITDLNMPAMRGDELVARLRKIDPELAVLLVSGSIAYPAIDELLRNGSVEFLPKPFRGQDLADAVARLMRFSRRPPPRATEGK